MSYQTLYPACVSFSYSVMHWSWPEPCAQGLSRVVAMYYYYYYYSTV